jgi:alpha 1,2-mannosyltransferase
VFCIFLRHSTVGICIKFCHLPSCIPHPSDHSAAADIDACLAAMTAAAHQRQGGSQRSKRHHHKLIIGLLSIFILSIGISQIILAENAIQLSSSSSSSSPTAFDRQEEVVSKQTQAVQYPATTATDEIVYLAQFSQHHSTYGAQHDIENNTISGNSKLIQSLDLLYLNYINQHHFSNNNKNVDILIFYIPEEGVPTNNTLQELQLSNRPQIKLHPLNSTKYWSLPSNLHKHDAIHWNRPMYSIGYRHMMRWFAIHIWPYLSLRGYTHVMRLDDDSYIHSPITYNLFEYMRDHEKVYGFRQPVIEEGVGVGWDALIDSLVDGYNDPNNRDGTAIISQEQIDEFRKDRRISFYNNFFIANINFFTTPPASTLLKWIDESNLIYTQRTGDLVIHSTVVRLLLPPERIHWFRDFAYQHMTLCTKPQCGHGVVKGCPQNGGLSRGVGTFTDDEWNAITKDMKQKTQYDKKVVDLRVDRPDRICQNMIRTQTFIGALDVRKCLKRKERCYPYLKQFLNDTEATETSSLIPS